MIWIATGITIAAFLPIVAAGIAKAGGRDFSNRDPRAWLAQQTGFRARANAAQANTFEALPLFYLAVVLCLIRLPSEHWSVLQIAMAAWLVLRFLYILCYVKDWATTRSLVWVSALGVNLFMVWTAANAA